MDLSAFTDRDKELVFAAFLAHKNPFEVDWNEMANLAGFKNGRSAQVCFGSTKKKIQGMPVSKPKPATPKKAASSTNAKTGDGSPPPKKRKKTKAEEADEGAEEDDAIVIKEE